MLQRGGRKVNRDETNERYETDERVERDGETPQSRLFFVQCHMCGAGRSVSTIKTGYLATQRGERRAARNK